MSNLLKWIESNLRFLQMVTDLVVVFLAWTISYAVRFFFIGHAQVGLETLFLTWTVPLALITFYFLLRNGHYDRQRLYSIVSDVMTALRANALSVVSFIVVLYFFSETRISRLTIVIYAVVSTVLLISARVFFRSMTRKMRRRGHLLRHVFVVGDGPQVQRYLNSIDYTPAAGLKIDGVFGESQSKLAGVPTFPLDALESRIQQTQPDFVVFGFKNQSDPFVTNFIAKYYDSLFKIQVLTDDNYALLGLEMESIDGLHVMTLNQPRFSIPELTLKRVLDLLGSGIGLLLLSPFFAALALAIRLSSSGPAFFGQERVGLNGSTFKMWKFRTMRTSSDPSESKGWTIENDPRRTKLGTFLRKTSIDELPQLWNVFVGEMSLVGPRPEQSHFVEKFRAEIPAYMLRHKIKAGITGWAQVSGWRGDTSLQKRIEYDLYYIRHWSLWFDLKILLLTVVRGFVNKNAY